MVQTCFHLRSGFVRINQYVVTNAIRRPEANHRIGADQILTHQVFKHRLGIFVEFPCGLTDDLVIKNRGELARQLPGIEERVPVDVINQFSQGIALECPCAGECWYGRGLPVYVGAIILSMGIRQQITFSPTMFVALSNHGVLCAQLLAKCGFEFFAE